MVTHVALRLRSQACVISTFAWSQGREPPDLSIELVDPKVLRVCADPHNLPFSNEQGEGFENKLAAMLRRKAWQDGSPTRGIRKPPASCEIRSARTGAT